MVAGQRRCRSRPATRSASSPASTCPGRFGMRLEDIVVATAAGPRRLNERRARPRARRLRRPTVKLDAGTFLLQVGHGRARCSAGSRRRRREVSLGYGWLLRSVYGVLALAARSRSSLAGRSRQRRARARGSSARRSRPPSRSWCPSCGAAPACAAAVELRAERAGARRGDGRPRRPTTRRPSASGRAEFPPALDLDRAGRSACVGAARRRGVRGRSVRARRGAPARRRRVPRRGQRRDAARPLVPRAAGPAPRPAEGARASGPRSSGRSRSRCSSGRSAWCRCSTARSTTATTACSAGSGSCARSRRSASSCMTWLALKERYYSAVMAATGLLYLAILTAFGTDLIARAVLRP